MSHPETYRVEINGIARDLRLFEVAPNVRIAIVNILGDTEFVQAISTALIQKLDRTSFDVIVTAEAKSIPLAYQMSVDMKKPYVVLRKVYRSYMGEAIKAETNSITTGSSQTLYLDEKDLTLVNRKRILLLDDVISTGSTLMGMQTIIEKAGGIVVKIAAIFTEGDPQKWTHVVALGNLPVWVD
ncbi:MAG: adenine phosphoribosyltransferase [Phototrophicales bacterium]|nr:MAG: adenine phosphoribosyltransferase [Phototrophicales bacterium]